MSPTSSSDTSSSWIPIVSSVGLFLATTLLSQWVQAVAKRDSTARDTTTCPRCDEMQFQYQRRRTQDRLSYENLSDALPGPSANDSVHNVSRASSHLGYSTPSSPVRPTEWDLHLKRDNTSKTALSSKLRREQPISKEQERRHPNSNYDFHPKNRNWHHFEQINENDKKEMMEQGHGAFLDPSFRESERSHVAQLWMGEQPPIHEEDMGKSRDQNDNTTDSDSETSEEHFVWMNQSPPNRAQRSDSNESSTWPDSWQKRVPSFLNLFRESENPQESDPKATQGSAPVDPPMRFPPPRHRYHRAASDQPFPSGHNSTSSRRTNSASDLLGMNNREMSMESDHRRLRTRYNANIMPEKVILVRHGQSLGNINELYYAEIPDNAMPLTRLGWEQAQEAGKILRNKILASGESVHFIVSPYVRTVETFHGIVSAWCDPKEFSHITNKEKRIKAWYGRLMEMGLTWNEDSRIREQDFGNYQDPETIKRAKQERHRFGIFYYRFPHGESASDVFDRVSTFLDSLWRSFEMNQSRNYVLVTHGISIRVLLARYFRYTIGQFNIMANPKNCEMVVLGHDGEGRLELQGRCALEIGEREGENEHGEEGKMAVVGYKFHKRLRILPRHAIQRVKIRISPDE